MQILLIYKANLSLLWVCIKVNKDFVRFWELPNNLNWDNFVFLLGLAIYLLMKISFRVNFHIFNYRAMILVHWENSKHLDLILAKIITIISYTNLDYYRIHNLLKINIKLQYFNGKAYWKSLKSYWDWLTHFKCCNF